MRGAPSFRLGSGSSPVRRESYAAVRRFFADRVGADRADQERRGQEKVAETKQSAAGKKDAAVPDNVRCTATTQDGERCKRKAQDGSNPCWQHAGMQKKGASKAKNS